VAVVSSAFALVQPSLSSPPKALVRRPVRQKEKPASTIADEGKRKGKKDLKTSGFPEKGYKKTEP
jgi:hypothetical protein